MARASIPDPLARRHLLERTLSSAQALSIAEAYLEADRPCDSLAFLERVDDKSLLDGLREKAIESGDAFLLRAVAQAAGVDAPASAWAKLAETARSQGKLLYAEQARRHHAGGDS